MTDPTATMHVHTTPDGHHYLVEGPEETCPAAEHVRVGADTSTRDGRRTGTDRGRRRTPAVVQIATIALVTYAVALGLVRVGTAVLGGKNR
ncbi:hypothetical protein KZX45_13915 [Georgenia sp. EYE_87]|uniref:hypothetical protein n=1 Tax=Georgenia sp. EYE_87 TaxID=2853448 RepID=UPI0020040367|nr:hypothetical protein [Georgenia sp. EYE_87]MCK6211641.1 hypothetical protein [Georgenia sp. EYE_87]